MQAQPLVSIITITRNRGNLIGRCIKSVLNQTYTNFEHIVVDGASDDDTDKVISQFNDPRLKYIKLPINEPVVKTINIGFEKSQGAYVTFLDSDDEYLPDKIEKQLSLIQTLPVEYGMVYCWMAYFDNQTKKNIKTHKIELRGSVATEVVEKEAVSGTPTFFFRREVFEELGGWKDNIGIISDWELGARCCQKWKVDYVPEVLVNVYVNHGFLRMTDVSYYDKIATKEIIFRNYFLETFKDIFKIYPTKAHIHYFVLIRSHAQLNQRKFAYKYLLHYCKAMRFNLKCFARLIAGIVFIILGKNINNFKIWN